MASSSRIVPNPSLAPAPVVSRQCFVPQALFPVKDTGPRLPKIFYPPGGFGIPMDQLLNPDKDALRRIMPLFDHRIILTLGLRSIKFVILWPGYEHRKFYREIYLSMPGAGGVSCVGELAMAIADTYDGFLKQAASWTPQGNRNQEWFLTKGSAFTLKDFALVSAMHMGADIFQAEVELRTWRAGIPYAAPVVLPAPRVSPSGPASRNHIQLELPTPAPVPTPTLMPAPVPAPVSAQTQTWPDFFGPAFDSNSDQQAYIRSVCLRDPEKFRQSAEAFAAQVENAITVEDILTWSLQGPPGPAEEELPGPTGGLMYPDD